MSWRNIFPWSSISKEQRGFILNGEDQTKNHQLLNLSFWI